jgi:tRNA pseudouridine55 synthase
MYSAVKHKGRPLYKLARKGQEINREPKIVNIKLFSIEKFSGNELHFKVLCSKGTYIRALVNDFGEKLKTGAYLKELRRTKIGNFDVSNSITPDEFIEKCKIKIQKQIN